MISAKCSWSVQGNRAVTDAIVTFEVPKNDVLDIEDAITAENCIQLEAPLPDDDTQMPVIPSCQLFLTCPQGFEFVSLSALSEAKLIEVYGSRGEYVSTLKNRLMEEVDGMAVYRGDVEHTAAELCLKMMPSKQEALTLWLYGITVVYRVRQSGPAIHSPHLPMRDIDERLQGTQLSDRAKAFKNTMQAFQAMPAPMMMPWALMGGSNTMLASSANSNCAPSLDVSKQAAQMAQLAQFQQLLQQFQANAAASTVQLSSTNTATSAPPTTAATSSSFAPLGGEDSHSHSESRSSTVRSDFAGNPQQMLMDQLGRMMQGDPLEIAAMQPAAKEAAQDIMDRLAELLLAKASGEIVSPKAPSRPNSELTGNIELQHRPSTLFPSPPLPPPPLPSTTAPYAPDPGATQALMAQLRELIDDVRALRERERVMAAPLINELRERGEGMGSGGRESNAGKGSGPSEEEKGGKAKEDHTRREGESMVESTREAVAGALRDLTPLLINELKQQLLPASSSGAAVSGGAGTSPTSVQAAVDGLHRSDTPSTSGTTPSTSEATTVVRVVLAEKGCQSEPQIPPDLVAEYRDGGVQTDPIIVAPAEPLIDIPSTLATLEHRIVGNIMQRVSAEHIELSQRLATQLATAEERINNRLDAIIDALQGIANAEDEDASVDEAIIEETSQHASL